MVETVTELTKARRAKLWDTIQQLNDEGLRARVEASFLNTERTIEAWHAFVDSVEAAMHSMRTHLTSDRSGATESLTPLAS